ncbi:sigma-70 family RNA polymerase sigma factor [Patescibacteria group bacterium]|nr:sigma-70 family RNA polymerase sigma factor [Patescibacteria group bacterium]
MKETAENYPQKYLEMSDEQLAAGALADQSCFGELLRRYQARMINYFFKFYFLDKFECEDIVQEAFIKTYSSLPHFDAKRKFRPWFYKIAENTAKNYLRACRKSSYLPISFEPAAREDMERYMDGIFFMESLNLKVMELPEMQRRIAVLYFSDQMAPNEIAGQVNLPATIVRTNIEAVRRIILSKIFIEK